MGYKFNTAPCPSVWTRPTCGRHTLVDWLPRPTTAVLPLTMLCKLLASTRTPSLMGRNTHTGLSGTPGRTHGAKQATFGWNMAKITVASRRRPRLCKWPDDLWFMNFIFSFQHPFFWFMARIYGSRLGLRRIGVSIFFLS